MPFDVIDRELKVTLALPNGAATTTSTGIDLGVGTQSDFSANTELVIDGPVLTTAELPNTQTITYDVYHDTASGFGTETLLATLGTQVGAGGAGAAAKTFRMGFPSNVKRYIRVKTTNSGAGNASGKSATIAPRF